LNNPSSKNKNIYLLFHGFQSSERVYKTEYVFFLFHKINSIRLQECNLKSPFFYPWFFSLQTQSMCFVWRRGSFISLDISHKILLLYKDESKKWLYISVFRKKNISVTHLKKISWQVHVKIYFLTHSFRFNTILTKMSYFFFKKNCRTTVVLTKSLYLFFFLKEKMTKFFATRTPLY